jgi:hypothetical protein
VGPGNGCKEAPKTLESIDNLIHSITAFVFLVPKVSSEEQVKLKAKTTCGGWTTGIKGRYHYTEPRVSRTARWIGQRGRVETITWVMRDGVGVFEKSLGNKRPNLS